MLGPLLKDPQGLCSSFFLLSLSHISISHPCCTSLSHTFMAYLICISLSHIVFAYHCCISLLHIFIACLRLHCISSLHIFIAYRYCISLLHVFMAYLSCRSSLLFFFAKPAPGQRAGGRSCQVKHAHGACADPEGGPSIVGPWRHASSVPDLSKLSPPGCPQGSQPRELGPACAASQIGR